MLSKSTTNFSVVIPNYNGSSFLENCLKSLKKSIEKCPESTFEVILVDNNSDDNSRQIFIKYFKRIILLDKNYGFAVAVNRGILSSKYDYICILNNDLNLSPEWFAKIQKNISKFPKAAAFCGTVLDKSSKYIESQGLEFDMSGKCLQLNHGLKIVNCKLKIKHVWGSSAAAVVYKRKAILKAGLFDESFFAYIEDVDLSFRLNRLGYQTIFNPQAISYHIGGSTSNRMGNLRQLYTFRNWIKLIHKNYSTKEKIIYFFPIAIERLRNLSYLLKSTPLSKLIPTAIKLLNG